MSSNFVYKNRLSTIFIKKVDWSFRTSLGLGGSDSLIEPHPKLFVDNFCIQKLLNTNYIKENLDKK